MKTKSLLTAIFILLITGSFAQSMIVGTYNLRYENTRDTGNLWVNRMPVVNSLIRFHDFDILGTQEILSGMINDISNALPEYDHYGIGRDDGKDAGEHSVIFYKKDKFKLLTKGDFWLSQTPEKPSIGWDATCCNRICSWVYLQDKKTNRQFYVFNTHYDYQKDLARNESSKLILSEIKKIAGNKPVIFMGDLNGGHETSWYQRIATSGWLNDSYSKVPFPYAFNPSFQDFGKSLGTDDIIDHIFISNNFKVKRWGILSDSYKGKYPSDHMPVLAEIVWDR